MGQWLDLPKDKQAALWQERPRSESTLIRCHLRLAASRASRMVKRFRLSPDDAITSAAEGLLQAVRGYDPGRGFAFSVYAVKIIDRQITKDAGDMAPIYLPIGRRSEITRISRAREELLERGKQATPEAISEITGLSLQEIETIGNAVSVSSMEDICEQGLEPWVDTREDGTGLMEDVKRGLQFLTGKEAYVCSHVWGVTLPEMTLEEIALNLNVSKERVRQLRQTGTEKMRAFLKEER